jgi:hypothetical protein
VLDSIQKILFPLGSESEALLCSLVSRKGFDPDCLRYGHTGPGLYRRDDEEEIKYYYFGSRLMDLFEEMENPTPRGVLTKWLERKSGARYAMMVALAGFVAAIMLGVFGLAVGIIQAWIAYEAWKYPVVNTV